MSMSCNRAFCTAWACCMIEFFVYSLRCYMVYCLDILYGYVPRLNVTWKFLCMLIGHVTCSLFTYQQWKELDRLGKKKKKKKKVGLILLCSCPNLKSFPFIYISLHFLKISVSSFSLWLNINHSISHSFCENDWTE